MMFIDHNLIEIPQVARPRGDARWSGLDDTDAANSKRTTRN